LAKRHVLICLKGRKVKLTTTYEIGNSLYLNITNRCTNRCDFCIRETATGIGEGLNLWLEHEPTVKEILNDIERYDLSRYKEIVFCGYGEPLMRLYDVVEICKEIKEKNSIYIRINTNGQANLIYEKDITGMFKDIVDCISISLNAASSALYDKVCHSTYGENAFHSILDFALKCREHVSAVILSVVDVMSQTEIEDCKKLAENIGIDFRIRHFSGQD
jgi:TatD family-associated radical SAM protein